MYTFTRIVAALGMSCLVVLAGSTQAKETQEDVAHTFDNLVPVEGSRMQTAFIDPDADFSVFKRVAILKPAVAFRRNWQRDQNRGRTTNVSSRDMKRIQEGAANLFEQVFTEKLTAAGYAVTTESDEDVLVLKPAIVDLDVTAPDIQSAGRSRTFTTTSAAATLYVELFDGLTGDIIGRAADRQVMRHNAGYLTWTNSVTNTADARRMFGRWADTLIEFLDSHYR